MLTGVVRAAFQQYLVLRNPEVRILENKEGLPWSAYVGVCGMPGAFLDDTSSPRRNSARIGKTAHHGWMEYAHPKIQKVTMLPLILVCQLRSPLCKGRCRFRHSRLWYVPQSSQLA